MPPSSRPIRRRGWKFSATSDFRENIETPAGDHKTLRHCGYIAAQILIGFKNQRPLLAEAWAMVLYRSLQAVASSKAKSWTTILPLIEEDKEFLPGLSPVERTTLSAYFREKKSLLDSLGGGGQTTAGPKLSAADRKKAAAAAKALAKAQQAAAAAAAAAPKTK